MRLRRRVEQMGDVLKLSQALGPLTELVATFSSVKLGEEWRADRIKASTPI